LKLNRAAALGSFQLWLDLISHGVAPANSAEVKTGDTINEFAAGQAVFALNWGHAWDIFSTASQSRVVGRFGVARPPRVEGGENVTTLGGYQWALSAFSRHKPETAALLRHLTSEAVARRLVISGYSLPSRARAYSDPAILAARPWLAGAASVVLAGRPRPVTPRYSEVSETIRRTTSAVIGGTLSPEEGVDEIERRLRRVLR
jgi:multiple sugar transport system substrate-binding protein